MDLLENYWRFIVKIKKLLLKKTDNDEHDTIGAYKKKTKKMKVKKDKIKSTKGY